MSNKALYRHKRSGDLPDMVAGRLLYALPDELSGVEVLMFLSVLIGDVGS